MKPPRSEPSTTMMPMRKPINTPPPLGTPRNTPGLWNQHPGNSAVVTLWANGEFLTGGVDVLCIRFCAAFTGTKDLRSTSIGVRAESGFQNADNERGLPA